jgi:[acyl-carrier-protein] S-malonyltransferase
MTAFVFPGQGSQYVGMGKDIYESSPEAKKIFERADDALGFALSKICFEGPDEQLKQTENTQPAIFLHSVAALSGLRAKPSMVAGHSLGEYSALYAAGAIDFEDAIRLVRLRGELMQRCGVEQPGTMAAVIGLDEKTIGEVCCTAWSTGIVQAANFNSPGQVVISGSVAGVREAMKLAKERGAKLVKELNVSGAFHSPLMQSAQEGLQAAIEKTNFRDASVPVYANVTAQAVTSASEIKELLVKQLTNPVRWTETVQNMAAAGATEFLEVGPGAVLQGLIKRIASGVATKGADKWTDIQSN